VDSDEELYMLDQLPVVASVTSTWPLRRVVLVDADPMIAMRDEATDVDVKAEVRSIQNAPVEEVTWSPRNYNDAPGGATIRRDDETDEMDAVEQ
jgi:hypothetical protein